jgi:hypothetical protein
MRRLHILLPALATALALAACSSDSSSETQDAAQPATASATPSEASEASEASETSETRYDGPTIPEGMWTRHLTPHEVRTGLRQRGLPEDLAGSFSKDLAYSIRIGDGVWAQYQALDGGSPDVGDSGTFTYDGDGNVVTVSESTGCPGCVIVGRWSLEGPELTFEVVPGHDEDDMATFVMEGVYEVVND